MANEAFVLGLAVICVFLVVWACKTLPAEQWQILASVPISKDESGRWRGINLTYYGLLTATAAVMAVAILCILMTAIAVPLIGTLTVVIVEIMLCLPAAKVVARMVEGKECTFTVGGAFFVGLLVAPWLVAVVNATIGSQGEFSMPIPATLAAVMIAHAFGEGLGRLACINFGCCYGRPLSQLPPALSRLFKRWHFVFCGKTKKIAYASRMDGERVLPIQALTAVLYLTTGLIATSLFLQAHFSVAFIVVVAITQGWRIVSEMFRADYRGEGTISAYQWMGALTIPYAVCLTPLIASQSTPIPNAVLGLQSLWDPTVVVLLQGLWYALFLFFGRSMVTGAEISFHVHYDRI